MRKTRFSWEVFRTFLCVFFTKIYLDQIVDYVLIVFSETNEISLSLTNLSPYMSYEDKMIKQAITLKAIVQITAMVLCALQLFYAFEG